MLYALLERPCAILAILFGVILTFVVYRDNINLILLSFLQNVFHILDVLRIKICSCLDRWLRPKKLERQNVENVEQALNHLQQYNAALKKIIYNYPENKNLNSNFVAKFIAELKKKKENEDTILELAPPEDNGSSPQMENDNLIK